MRAGAGVKGVLLPEETGGLWCDSQWEAEGLWDLRAGDGPGEELDCLKEGPSHWVRPEASGISFGSRHLRGWDRIAHATHRNLPLFPAGGEMP